MIDTHCHIDEKAFDGDREEVIIRQREAGVEAMIVPGINDASIITVLDVCRSHAGFCYPALGLHPEEVKEDWREKLAVVEEAIRVHHNELVAIGEIGLDYHWDKTYEVEQKEVLRCQLLLARELNLPVILHNRDATEDILRIVREVADEKRPEAGTFFPLRGVFHCFNGSKETAQLILEMDFCLGIGGVLTFKNCKLGDTLAALQELSSFQGENRLLDRLLLETDAPYMAPVPHRGERNESRFIDYVAERLSVLLQTDKNRIIEATSANSKRIFSIK